MLRPEARLPPQGRPQVRGCRSLGVGAQGQGAGEPGGYMCPGAPRGNTPDPCPRPVLCAITASRTLSSDTQGIPQAAGAPAQQSTCRWPCQALLEWPAAGGELPADAPVLERCCDCGRTSCLQAGVRKMGLAHHSFRGLANLPAAWDGRCPSGCLASTPRSGWSGSRIWFLCRLGLF